MVFCLVKHGANKETIINPDCMAISLLDYLKVQANFTHITEPLDLSTEDGEIVDLNSKIKENAKIYLEDRCVYVLVRVMSEEGSEEPLYAPLCDSYDKIKFAISTNAKKNKIKGHVPKDREVSGSMMDASMEDKKKAASSKNVPLKKK